MVHLAAIRFSALVQDGNMLCAWRGNDVLSSYIDKCTRVHFCPGAAATTAQTSMHPFSHHPNLSTRNGWTLQLF